MDTAAAQLLSGCRKAVGRWPVSFSSWLHMPLVAWKSACPSSSSAPEHHLYSKDWVFIAGVFKCREVRMKGSTVFRLSFYLSGLLDFWEESWNWSVSISSSNLPFVVFPFTFFIVILMLDTSHLEAGSQLAWMS